MKPIWLVLNIFIFNLIYTQATAQSVGLVLSGGGAKGLAHVGVLKALEENEIPIDYIVGSSMGAVIGGFYAAGYSPTEIEKIVTSNDFQDWVRGYIDSKYVFHYSTKDLNASILSVNLSLDSARHTQLSTSLAPDHTINFALTEYLSQASQRANYNFDSLMIPFRAMASEIFTQEEQVLKKGSLGQALRASMAVPFFFRPIKVDGKFMFDGGVYNNFPVDVLKKEFNPDVIIGVNVSSKVFNEYPKENDEELLSQSLLFMFLDKSDPTVVGEKGIYIEPDLSKYSALDFPKVKGILDSGYVASSRKIKEIKSKIERLEDCDILAKKRNEFLMDTKPLSFGRMDFVGFTENQEKYLSALFKHGDKNFNISDVKQSYYKLISDEYFRDVYPVILYDYDRNFYKFKISGKARSNVNGELGGNLASRSISEIYLGLNYTHFNRFLTRHSVSFYTGRFYQSVSVKSRMHLPISKPLYIEPEFMFNQWDFLNADEIVFDNRISTAINQIDRKFAINIGFAAGSRGKLVIQNAIINNDDSFLNTDILVSADTLDKLSLKGSKHGLEYSRSSLNRKQYASKGDAFSLSAYYLNLDEIYEPGSTSKIGAISEKTHQWFKVTLEAEKYFKLKKFSSGYYLNATFSNQLLLSNYRATIITAPTYYPLQDSRSLFQENLRAFSFIAIGWRNVFEIKRNLDFRFETYLFTPLVSIKEEADQTAMRDTKIDNFYFSGTSGLVYHSPVGPISISINYYDNPRQKRDFGALLHIGYLLFNKRSME